MNIKPSHFTIVFTVGPIYVGVFSSRKKRPGIWENEFADTDELRTLLKAIADPILFPLCTNYSWATPVVETYLKNSGEKNV